MMVVGGGWREGGATQLCVCLGPDDGIRRDTGLELSRGGSSLDGSRRRLEPWRSWMQQMDA